MGKTEKGRRGCCYKEEERGPAWQMCEQPWERPGGPVGRAGVVGGPRSGGRGGLHGPGPSAPCLPGQGPQWAMTWLAGVPGTACG